MCSHTIFHTLPKLPHCFHQAHRSFCLQLFPLNFRRLVHTEPCQQFNLQQQSLVCVLEGYLSQYTSMC